MPRMSAFTFKYYLYTFPEASEKREEESQAPAAGAQLGGNGSGRRWGRGEGPNEATRKNEYEEAAQIRKRDEDAKQEMVRKSVEKQNRMKKEQKEREAALRKQHLIHYGGS